MSNLWAFLLQTLWASLSAALILIVKRLLEDKLSPRWQYGVWGLLAARLLLPASLSRYVVLPVSAWLELAKTAAERNLSSAYAAPYAPVTVHFPFPTLSAAPRSVTDWLFVAYCAGVAAAFLRYATAYTRLRLSLRRCPPVRPDVQELLNRTAARYGLPVCRAVETDLPSAMVCGALRPILALPGGDAPDEKILLHELLHLKYHDTAQNAFWSILRAFHWCNPFLWAVFDRIQNDLESLCDQRALERLRGGERREYGLLLLRQATVRYARFPGTSSISNGAANIRRRVEAIARFQRYPRGMALASACIALTLGASVLYGTASAYPAEDFAVVSELALARTRIQRCGTLAGALDTYAKALMLSNRYYFATASPLSMQEEISQLRDKPLFPDTPDLIVGSYAVANLERDGDGYRAFIAFASANPNSGAPDSAILPVRVRHSPVLLEGWIVERNGPWNIQEGETIQRGFPLISGYESVPFMGESETRGKTGTLSARWQTALYVNNEKERPDWPFPLAGFFDTALKPDARFDSARIQTEIRYALREGLSGPEQSIGLQGAPLSNPEQDWQFEAERLTGFGGGGGSDGQAQMNERRPEDWDGSAQLWLSNLEAKVRGGTVALPAAYRVRVFWDSYPVETLTVEGGGAYG